jgi:hypothetical protein
MKRLTGTILIGLITAAITLAVLLLRGSQPESKPAQTKLGQHLYVTWDTMEFDKCVAAWLIVRFIDKDAQFVLVPEGTDVSKGVPFDIPGAEWSRKHRKCTSQCILESIKNPDPAIERIVLMASQTELNFWQLDRWPETQKCFYEVRGITNTADGPLECFEKTRPYFDQLYNEFKNETELNAEFDKEKVQ